MQMKDIAKAYVEVKKRLESQGYTSPSESTAALYRMEHDIYGIVKDQHDIFDLRFRIRSLEIRREERMRDLESLLKESGIMNDIVDTEEKDK